MRQFSLLLAAALLVAGCPDEGERDEQAKPDQPAADRVAAADAGPAAAAERIAEVEPNDKTVEAMKIARACIVEAELEAAAGKKRRPMDWYRIEPGGSRILSVELSAIEGVDARLVFRDADRNEMFYVDSGRKGEAEQYPNLLVEDAVYLKVDADRGSPGGAYTLQIGFADPEPGRESEFNGRYSLADELALGGSVEGLLGHQRDEDWYLLALDEMATGAVLRIDLTAVEGVRPQLVISDQEERRPLLEVSANKAGDGIVVRNMGVPAGAEAVYLTVKSAWVPGPKPKKYVRTYNPDQAYTLSVSSEAGGDDLEKEPNDEADTAFPVADGQKVRGYLAAPNDEDWYVIEVERPSILSAELSALDRVDLQLYCIDPEKKDQKRNAELVRINDGKVNEPEVLTNCAVQPGENYLKVAAAWKKIDGKWVQDDYNLDETYSLTVNLRTDEGREEREPNDELEQATAIEVGQTLRGTMHPRRDVDLYQLDLSEQDGPRNTTIECSGIPKVDVALKLLGPERDEDGKHETVAVSAKGKDEEKEQITEELMPGVYWIVVRGGRHDGSNTSDQYVLTVTQ